MKKTKPKHKPIYTAFIAGILFFVVGVINSGFDDIFIAAFGFSTGMLLSFILSSVIGIAIAWVYYTGFLVIAKKYKNPLLHTMAIIGIVASILSPIAIAVAYNSVGFSGLEDKLSVLESVDESEYENNPAVATVLIQVVTSAFVLVFILYLMFALIYGAMSILYGIALIRLPSKLKYAQTAGILNIVAGATYFILVGFIVKLVAKVFEIVVLYQTSIIVEGKN